MHALPDLKNIEAFDAWRAEPSQCLPAALDIARSHGLPCADPHVFATGSNLVVALDDALVLKVFPPLLRHQFESERALLTQLRGRIGVPIPEIVLEGERDRWPYLVITRLNGIVGTQVWPALPEDQRSGSSAGSARPSRKYSASRSASFPASSRAGMNSSRGKSRAATPGMCALACRENISTGWTRICATRRT